MSRDDDEGITKDHLYLSFKYFKFKRRIGREISESKGIFLDIFDCLCLMIS